MWFVGVTSVLIDIPWVRSTGSNFIIWLVIPQLYVRPFLQALALMGIASWLTVSYSYIVKRSANEARVHLIYAAVALLIAVAFVFSEYKVHRERLAIKEVCTQFDSVVARKDYETAYELMSPDYRQTHSLTQFVENEGSRFACKRQPTKIVGVVLFHAHARYASVIGLPLGFTNAEIYLEKVDGRWYFTGQRRPFLGRL